MITNRRLLVLVAVSGLLVSTCRADGIGIQFSGTGFPPGPDGGPRAARVLFYQSFSNPTELKVVLTNSSSQDALVPVDVLTAVFFSLSGNPVLSVAGGLAKRSSHSSILHAPATQVSGPLSPSGKDVGGEWAYKTPASGSGGSLPGGGNQALSSSGLGVVGPPDRFRTDSNLQGPDSPDGLQYGITTAGDNPTTGNAPMTGKNALIQDSVVFRLTGLPAGFDVTTGVSNVFFQYGTNLSEGGFGSSDSRLVPEPSSVSLCLIGISALAWRTRRLRRARRKIHLSSDSDGS